MNLVNKTPGFCLNVSSMLWVCHRGHKTVSPPPPVMEPGAAIRTETTEVTVAQEHLARPLFCLACLIREISFDPCGQKGCCLATSLLLTRDRVRSQSRVLVAPLANCAKESSRRKVGSGLGHGQLQGVWPGRLTVHQARLLCRVDFKHLAEDTDPRSVRSAPTPRGVRCL